MRLFVILLILMQSVFSQTVRLGQDTTEPKVVVSGADYKVNVCGPLTEINATITVYNQDRNEDRVTFFYKLPDEATVTGFALDLNGKMRRASAVEKHKARIAFETEVRGKIDPALIEWNQGNVFQTQIYPVEGNGIRKVTVSYIIPTSDLIEIPLQFQKLNQFNFTVSSPDPVSVGGPAEMLKLTNSDNSYVELRAEGSAVEGAFKIKLSGEKNKLYAEKNKDKSLYWIYKEPLSLPAEQVSFANTGSIAVYQDISLSRDSADLQKETDFLMGLVKHIGKPVTVELYRFHVSSKFYKKYTVGSDDSFNEFAQDYHNCTVDGGTDFSKLTPLLKSCKADMKIIFSDGLNNYSNFSGSEKVFTINSSSEIDSFALRNLGQRNINLNGVSTSEALQIFITKPLLIKSDTADTFGEVKNGWLTVTGKLKPREKAEFAIYQGSIQLREITVNPERITDSNIVRKYWSLKKLHSLMNDRLKNKNEITELGELYSLVTPYTSLIVMESIDQYLDYEIRPPDEEPVLQALYDKRIKDRKADVIEDQTAEVKKEWDKYKKWWEKYFAGKKAPPAIVKADKRMDDIERTIAKMNAERANEGGGDPAPPVNTVPEQPAEPAPVVAENVEESGRIKQEIKLEELIDSLKLPGNKKNQLDAIIKRLDETIEELNTENDDLKNTNGALRATNKRFSKQLEELKELYVKDRNVMPRRPKIGQESISFSKWTGDSVFIEILESSSEPYTEYLKLRESHKGSPGFYFECAEYFLAKEDNNKAYVILSNIIEISRKNTTLLRMAAYRMTDTEFLDEAIVLLREIIILRPEEPHSYRDLAQALIKKAEKTSQSIHKDTLYSEALSLYKKIIESSWQRQREFRGLTTILIQEYNNIILRSGKEFQLDSELKSKLDLDLRVVLSWDTDMTDVDLHILQPDGEKVYYSNKISNAGGRMSSDFTRGLGPETYGIRYALPGEYKIYGKVFNGDALFFNGYVSVKIDIYLNYGRPDQIHKSTTVKITETREEIELAKIKME